MSLERLQKIISAHGLASRRQAEGMILSGRVRLNGELATLGMSADPENDLVEVDGVALTKKPQFVYIVLNKPRGCVTTMNDERGRKTVHDIVDCAERVYPVGRLDLNSEGLLIMTNDGEVAHALQHPSSNIEKTYRVTVEPASEEKITLLREVDDLDGEKITPAIVRVTEQNGERYKVEVTILEGKNRQIRRMCEKCGMEVLRLKRIRVGEILLGRIRPGEWRYMTKEEIRYIKSVR